MCDYSLHDVASRPAKVGDKLVSTQFPNAITRGFADPTQPRVAVCLLPGTELAFDREVECDASFRFLPTRKSTHKVARFRQVNMNRPAAHHDALEFPDGKVVLVTDLCEGQHATVLQLPQHWPAGRGGKRARNREKRVTHRLRRRADRQAKQLREPPGAWWLSKVLECNTGLPRQRSSHFGSRFSMKAQMPSSASWAIMFSVITSEA